jgi:hypothetical protein
LEDVLLEDIEALDFFLQKAADEQYYDVGKLSRLVVVNNSAVH